MEAFISAPGMEKPWSRTTILELAIRPLGRESETRTDTLRASFGDMPAAMLRSVNASRCCCIFAFISDSRLRFRTSPNRRQNQARNRGIIYEAADRKSVV